MRREAEWSQQLHNRDTVEGETLHADGEAVFHRNHEDGAITGGCGTAGGGVFNPGFVTGLPELRAQEMEKFRWLEGEWSYENAVPATSASPAYNDIGTARYAFNEKSRWICMVSPAGEETPLITFDPFSRQWIFLLMNGAYGMLRSSAGWTGETIEFVGLMTMIGQNCEWRMTWTRNGPDQFTFTNEERNEEGSWAYIDQWQFERKA
jgi:hypothetical protein